MTILAFAITLLLIPFFAMFAELVLTMALSSVFVKFNIPNVFLGIISGIFNAFITANAIKFVFAWCGIEISWIPFVLSAIAWMVVIFINVKNRGINHSSKIHKARFWIIPLFLFLFY